MLACCVGAAFAAGPGSVRKQVEATLLVKGTIDIGVDGHVDGYTIEQQEKLPEGIAGMIDRVGPPVAVQAVEVDGRAANVRAGMSLRFIAKELDGGDYAVQIRDAGFNQSQPGEFVSSGKLRPPIYPPAAVRSGVGGTVYMALKIGRDGRVEEAVTEQVNLHVVTDEHAMGRWRDLLAKAALDTAKRWKFDPPTKGEEVNAPYRSVRVPVDFRFKDQPALKDSHWHAYVPGPRQTIPWLAADALAAGGVYPLNGAPRLLTSLEPT